MIGPLLAGERAAIRRWSYDRPTKQHRQHAEEQHQQQQSVVKGIGVGSLEDAIVGDVAAEDRPRSNVHQDQELDDVDEREHRGKERAQPDHPFGKEVVGEEAHDNVGGAGNSTGVQDQPLSTLSKNQA